MKIRSKLQPKQPPHHHIWDTILLYYYGLPIYLPYHMSKLFFWKKFGSKIPYLPTVWTYVQSFLFFFRTLSLTRSISTFSNPIIVKTQRNSTQRNSKATSVGVRHRNHVFHPPQPPHPNPPQTFQALLDQLES